MPNPPFDVKRNLFPFRVPFSGPAAKRFRLISKLRKLLQDDLKEPGDLGTAGTRKINPFDVAVNRILSCSPVRITTISRLVYFSLAHCDLDDNGRDSRASQRTKTIMKCRASRTVSGVGITMKSTTPHSRLLPRCTGDADCRCCFRFAYQGTAWNACSNNSPPALFPAI